LEVAQPESFVAYLATIPKFASVLAPEYLKRKFEAAAGERLG
jgi:hypothetical protein